ncbi:hypothetical protein, conserved [Eimeria maxima]|uniref:Uncharacterized protein n=1 Tax=Eimeria maxima TaxID=5804 RepID=U6M4X6_EIMMA|nr:hypothetical protein, conserved [Eimeria maxima]CDJ59287.1 hypothetical protein, conserved [Eimeria maxima]
MATRDELLRRRDARLMAFVRQQLMLPETEAEAETVCAANAEKGLCQQKKSVLGPPNVVLLTKKQRESLFQSNNKGDTSRRLMQDPEEQRQEQGACCEGRTSRGCGEVATLSLMLLHEEVQQRQKKK